MINYLKPKCVLSKRGRGKIISILLQLSFFQKIERELLVVVKYQDNDIDYSLHVGQ